MGNFRQNLIEVRQFVQDMKNSQKNACLENAQLTCQIWTLDRMIDAIEAANNLIRSIKQKTK